MNRDFWRQVWDAFLGRYNADYFRGEAHGRATTEAAVLRACADTIDAELTTYELGAQFGPIVAGWRADADRISKVKR